LPFAFYFTAMLIELCAWRFNLDNIETLSLSTQMREGLAALRSSAKAADFRVRALDPENFALHEGSPEATLVSDGNYCLLINWQTGCFTLSLNAGCRSPDLDFMQALNAILCLCAIRQGGLAVHAASVVFDNRAIILCGRSGAGKSTSANLLTPPCTIIDDDFTLIVQRENCFWAGSSPIRKDGSIDRKKNRLVPLQKVYYVCKAARPIIAPLVTAESMRALAPHVYALPAESAVSDQILSSMAQICRSVAQARLFFDCATAADDYIPMLFGEES
jgi:hypothetical protein